MSRDIAEEKRLADERAQSREIVNEILRFGVADRQLYQIINLLAMNLESYDAMCRITALVDSLAPTVDAWNAVKDDSLKRIAGELAVKEIER